MNTVLNKVLMKNLDLKVKVITKVMITMMMMIIMMMMTMKNMKNILIMKIVTIIIVSVNLICVYINVIKNVMIMIV